jgi:crotonobetainyl-CoA:carnitine CoA-transferase CaiB-like acyl-CoA transferase
VLDIGEVMQDPHLVARGFVLTGDHPVSGPRPMPAVPWSYDGVRPELRHAPLLGDRTDAALAELAGLGPAELQALRAERVLA